MIKRLAPNNIPHFREQKYLSQYLLALLIGCHVKSIARYESGETIPDIATAVRLSQALGVHVEALWRDSAEAWREDVLESQRGLGLIPGYEEDGNDSDT